jgi:thiamine-monophosphate kinase
VSATPRGGGPVTPERTASEDELIADLGAICATGAPQKLLLGIGDDAAAWRPSRSNLSVITTDALVEDVHFTRATMSARDVGFRAMAANLSDIAAMGARPVLATIALGISPDTGAAWIRELYEGMVQLAGRSGCAIAGGDITRAPAITIAITVVGEVRPSNLKRRSGARAGDIVAVTGPLGASRAGLRVVRDRPELAAEPRFAGVVRAFRTPQPGLAHGRWLGASRNVHALMDSSDGLSTDLARLCAASGVGATVESVPVDSGARAVAELLGDDPEAYALDGGEDFVLIAAIAARAFGYLGARFAQHFGTPLIRVGTMTVEGGLRRPSGTTIAPGGWDHLAG